MKRLFTILIAALATGCGTPEAPVEHAPAVVVPGDGSAAPPVSPALQGAPPEHVITGKNPLTDVGRRCKKSVDPLPGGGLPIVASVEELDALLRCKTKVSVDWTRERLVPVTLKGINRGWTFEGQSTHEGVTTITIRTHTMHRGAALHVKRLWLVRVPASTRRVVIRRTSAPQPRDAPLYP